MSGKLPAWLSAKVDQRMALVDQHVTPAALTMSGKLPLILTPLTEPSPLASDTVLSQWDRTCDCCGRFCPDEVDFYTGQVQRTTKGGVLVIMFFGVCEKHAHA